MFLNENTTHEDLIVDSDVQFIINPTTRAITTESAKVRLVQNDHNCERFTFEIQRFIEGHDMMNCNKVELHYINFSTNQSQKSDWTYILRDLHLSEDKRKVICTWLVSKRATMYAGTLQFNLRYACIEGGEEVYAFGTTDFKNIKIAERCNCAKVENPDDGTPPAEQEPEVHTHSYGSWKKYDENLHSKVCACGSANYGVHEWNSGVVTLEPTYESAGIKRYTCRVCGETKDVALDKIPKPEPTYIVYHGSTMKTVDLTNKANIMALAEANTKSFSSTFKKGHNIFVVAFPSEFASGITVTDETPNFSFTLNSTELIMMEDVDINELTYKVYAYTVGANDSDTPMSVKLT